MINVLGVNLKIVLLIALAVLILVITLYLISTYNRFQELKNGADATLNQIKVALKKRLDLLSQLLETVKSYANFEKETLKEITRYRSSILRSSSPEEINKVEVQSRALLGNLLFTVENYPELKTSEHVKALTESIRSIEDEISRHRYTYNNIVQEYNTLLDTFPSNIVGSFFGFKRLSYLEFEEDIEKRPNLTW